MNIVRYRLGALAVLLWAATATFGQRGLPPAPLPGAAAPGAVTDEMEPETDVTPRLKFSNATLEIVLNDYAEKTGRTILQGPGVKKATINLRSQSDLTLDEYLQAIESVLAMHGIALLKVGDKFLKVVPNTTARKESMPILDATREMFENETDELVSQLIALTHIDLSEAQKAIDFLKHTYGQIQLFERINSILVTDTQANINRILQIIGYIDQPSEAREVPNVVVIRYAKAADIKRKLEELIAEQQAELKKSTAPKARTSGPPGVIRPSVPGVIRAKRTVAAVATTTAELVEMAERGIIRGKVKIVADDRTNILIIITRPENMSFFSQIIKVLDVETDPDVMVKIVRLEYAEAEAVEATLNSLIGGKGKGREAVKSVAAKGEGEAGKSAALKEFVRRTQASAAAKVGKSKIGELAAENIKVLADKRTNALLLMASKSDMATLEELIKSMDIMLSQVMVEVVIIQVDLDDTISSGVHWVQRSIIAYEQGQNGSHDAVGAFAGRAGGGGSPVDATTLTSPGSWATGGGLTAYFTHFGLGIDAVVSMLQSDSRAQILSTPVIVTTDNTEAKITSSAQKYFLKDSTVDQFGNVRPQTEIKDIGLDLTVTPHINERRNVLMEIEQKVSDEGAPQTIALGGPQNPTGEFPTTVTRSFKASISVRDRETIVLGGLVRDSERTSKSGVPLLSRIPILGWFFRSDSDVDQRSEVVVFVTPYVLDTPEDIAYESKRRKEALNIKGLWQRGWSGSRLADSPGGNDGGKWQRSTRAVTQGAAQEQALSDGAAERGVESALDPDLIEFMRLQAERLGETVTDVDAGDGGGAVETK